MRSGFETHKLMKEIIDGKVSAPDDIFELLQRGYKLDCITNYLCPVCREFITDRSPFIMELIHVSPYGTIREYKMHYVFGKPKCPNCNTELIHILKPRSSKTKCPKCGTDHMIGSGTGFFD